MEHSSTRRAPRILATGAIRAAHWSTAHNATGIFAQGRPTVAITTDTALEILRSHRDRTARITDELDAAATVAHLDEIAKGIRHSAARPDPRLDTAAKVWLDSNIASRREAARRDLSLDERRENVR